MLSHLGRISLPLLALLEESPRKTQKKAAESKVSEEVFSLKHLEVAARDRTCAVKLLDRMFVNRIDESYCIRAKCLLLDCALQADSRS